MVSGRLREDSTGDFTDFVELYHLAPENSKQKLSKNTKPKQCAFYSKKSISLWSYSIRFYFPKMFLVGAMWFSAITMAVLEETNELRDPSFSYQLNTAHYKNFQLFFTAALALYVVYLMYLSLR